MYQPGLNQFEAVEQCLDLRIVTQHQWRGGVLVHDGRLRGQTGRMEVHCPVRQSHVAAQRQGISESRDDPGRIFVIRDEVHDCDQQKGDWLVEVNERAYRRFRQNGIRVAEIASTMLVVPPVSRALACTCTMGSLST
jgi:hypothetical protein